VRANAAECRKKVQKEKKLVDKLAKSGGHHIVDTKGVDGTTKAKRGEKTDEYILAVHEEAGNIELHSK